MKMDLLSELEAKKDAFQKKVKTVAPQLSKYKLSFYEVNFLPNLGGYDGIKKNIRR